MPFKFTLCWVPRKRKGYRGRWRKRYLGKDYYMKTKCTGKTTDRPGYLAALREWERLKAYIDRFGPKPYNEHGVLIPEHQQSTTQLTQSISNDTHVEFGNRLNIPNLISKPTGKLRFFNVNCKKRLFLF